MIKIVHVVQNLRKSLIKQQTSIISELENDNKKSQDGMECKVWSVILDTPIFSYSLFPRLTKAVVKCNSKER